MENKYIQSLKKQFPGEYDNAPEDIAPDNKYIASLRDYEENSRSRTLGGTLGDIGVASLKGAIELPQALVGLADIPTGGRVGNALESVGYKPKQALQTLDTLYSPAQQYANNQVQNAEGFFPTLGAIAQNPSTIGTAALESLPSMGGGGVIAKGAMKVLPKVLPKLSTTTGRIASGAFGEGAISAGSTEEQIRGETPDNLTTPTQSGLAALSGLGTGLIGGLSGKIANKLGIADIDTLAVGGTGRTTNQGILSSIGKGAVSEGLLEEAPQSAQEQALQNIALNKPALQGVGNAAAIGAVTGGVIGGAVGPLTRAAEQTQPIQPTEQDNGGSNTNGVNVPDGASISTGVGANEQPQPESAPTVNTEAKGANTGDIDNAGVTAGADELKPYEPKFDAEHITFGNGTKRKAIDTYNTLLNANGGDAQAAEQTTNNIIRQVNATLGSENAIRPTGISGKDNKASTGTGEGIGNTSTIPGSDEQGRDTVLPSGGTGRDVPRPSGEPAANADNRFGGDTLEPTVTPENPTTETQPTTEAQRETTKTTNETNAETKGQETLLGKQPSETVAKPIPFETPKFKAEIINPAVEVKGKKMVRVQTTHVNDNGNWVEKKTQQRNITPQTFKAIYGKTIEEVQNQPDTGINAPVSLDAQTKSNNNETGNIPTEQVYSGTTNKYFSDLGFTQPEIDEISQAKKEPAKVKDITGWARGRFGNARIKGVDFENKPVTTNPIASQSAPVVESQPVEPLPIDGYSQVRKGTDGKFRVFYRSTGNEVFPGKTFDKTSDAKKHLKAERDKSQNPSEPIKDNAPKNETVSAESVKGNKVVVKDNEKDVSSSVQHNGMFTNNEQTKKVNTEAPKPDDYATASEYHAAKLEYKKNGGQVTSEKSGKLNEINKKITSNEKRVQKLINENQGLRPEAIKNNAVRNITKDLEDLYNERDALLEKPTESTHIEGDGIERVSKEVIDDSLGKAAKANDKKSLNSKKEMQKWLVGKIDQAIAESKDVPIPSVYNDDRIGELQDERKSLISELEKGDPFEKGKDVIPIRNRVSEIGKEIQQIHSKQIGETVGHVIFDVPGDGKFKVTNTKENLVSFKKKVLASEWFKEARKQTDIRQIPFSKRQSIAEFVKDKEYANAYYAAEAAGTRLGFGSTQKEEPIIYVDVEPVDLIKGRELFVGRSFDSKGKSAWVVIDENSGMRVSAIEGDKSKETAISNAKEQIKTIGDRLESALKSAESKGKNQEQMLAWFKDKYGIEEDQPEVKQAKPEKTEETEKNKEKQTYTPPENLVKLFESAPKGQAKFTREALSGVDNSERVQYVQENFLDIIGKLEDDGKLVMNGDCP